MINSLEELVLAAMAHRMGDAVTSQVRDVVDDPSTAGEQNPNALEAGLDWLRGVSTGTHEADHRVAAMIDIVEAALEERRREE